MKSPKTRRTAASLASSPHPFGASRSGIDRSEIPQCNSPLILRAPDGYNLAFAMHWNSLMEAEQLNSISYKLDDLAQRAAELRRYL